MLRLFLTKQALKFIATLDAKQYKQVVGKILALAQEPEPPDSEQLKGYSSPLRRADVGEYRIVYHTEQDLLSVDRIGKRNDDEIYKELKRVYG